jgi:hypothetical protein
MAIGVREHDGVPGALDAEARGLGVGRRHLHRHREVGLGQNALRRRRAGPALRREFVRVPRGDRVRLRSTVRPLAMSRTF